MSSYRNDLGIPECGSSQNWSYSSLSLFHNHIDIVWLANMEIHTTVIY